MQNQVSTLPVPGATAPPFLPAPTQAMAPRCTCGDRLVLEMERDCGLCVECQARAAMDAVAQP